MTHFAARDHGDKTACHSYAQLIVQQTAIDIAPLLAARAIYDQFDSGGSQWPFG